jgi:hypothetical protein
MAELQMMHFGYADAYGLNLALWNQLTTAFPGNLPPAQSDEPGFRPRSKIHLPLIVARPPACGLSGVSA